ncbi:hypothetical protein [Oxalobacter paraformigenes]|uniref:Uncharacterized protein n=1 Tax=Oxalobacter paraformigenes TaxID=556268 RepID=T5LV06_9BURK|nr:hypothetical protein [Oxalobacter paraformigenes]EQM95323.1 hypothetical protein OFAG_02376 [Oxalobacter paraformigenes]
MQELIVLFIVTLSCCILYKYSFPCLWKYRIRLGLSRLSAYLHADTLAGKIHPGDKPKGSVYSCHGCRNCHTLQKTSTRPIRIFRKKESGD